MVLEDINILVITILNGYYVMLLQLSFQIKRDISR